VIEASHDGARFVVEAEKEGRREVFRARHLVVALGGKSIPKMGATSLGYRIAERFGLAVTETRPALVPFTLGEGRFASLAGVAAPVRAMAGQGRDRGRFEEAMLFTHRGLSGPAMLQASSYWREGEELALALAPDVDWAGTLREARAASPKAHPTRALARHLPARLADHLAAEAGLPATLGALSDARIEAVARGLSDWRLRPTGTEGYRTAEVTLGGVDTDGLHAKTLEARRVPGLYLIGEVVDVTGWLGGHNFQWAWSSAAAAARAIAARA
jgi:hypothetical protein